jgi:glycosyltransferase involved in cell wall biosynthesis
MKENSGTISCIIPTHNRVSLLPRAIASIQRQDYDNLEIIVVNDASTDETATVVTKLAEKDNRIRLITNKESRGGSGARNVGIRAAAGDFIALLDDDDEFSDNKLTGQLSFLEQKPSTGMVYGASVIIQPDGTRYLRKPKYRFIDARFLLQAYCQFSPPTTLIRKECFKTCGLFDESLPAYQDWDMWIRIARNYRIGRIPSITCIIHQEHELPRIGLSRNALTGYSIFRSKHYRNMSMVGRYIHDFKNRDLISGVAGEETGS